MRAIHGANLVPILNGTSQAPPTTMEIVDKDDNKAIVSNLEYEKWMSQDQQLLSYTLNSLTSNLLAQVAMLTSSASV
jgi:hypothetical protein